MLSLEDILKKKEDSSTEYKEAMHLLNKVSNSHPQRARGSGHTDEMDEWIEAFFQQKKIFKMIGGHSSIGSNWAWALPLIKHLLQLMLNNLNSYL